MTLRLFRSSLSYMPCHNPQINIMTKPGFFSLPGRDPNESNTKPHGLYLEFFCFVWFVIDYFNYFTISFEMHFLGWVLSLFELNSITVDSLGPIRNRSSLVQMMEWRSRCVGVWYSNSYFFRNCSHMNDVMWSNDNTTHASREEYHYLW